MFCNHSNAQIERSDAMNGLLNQVRVVQVQNHTMIMDMVWILAVTLTRPNKFHCVVGVYQK